MEVFFMDPLTEDDEDPNFPPYAVGWYYGNELFIVGPYETEELATEGMKSHDAPASHLIRSAPYFRNSGRY